MPEPRFLAGLAEVARRYPAILCDVWGVLHNGVAAFPGAVDALTRYRAGGGRVVLLTNAPRPHPPIVRQLAALGIGPAAYDRIVTSGDVTAARLVALGSPDALHIGPERDAELFEVARVRRVAEEAATIVVATGLVDDETEHPDDYRPLLARLAARRLPFFCANPDIVVERGDTLVWCAGALAAIYAEFGGETVLFGKPHPPIYAAADAVFADLLGRPAARSEILAIGDGLPTDIMGAARQGLDVLFITAGIHAADFGPVDAPDPARVAARLGAEGLTVTYAAPRLAW